MAKKRRLPPVLTQEEQDRLLKAFNRRYVTGLRNYTLTRLILNTGLRVGEAVNVRLMDIEWAQGELRVNGKGDKDRVLYLAPADLSALDTWLKRRRTLFSVDNGFSYLFITHTGSKLSTRYVHAMLKRIARRAGIEKKVYPHLLRHTYATDLLKHTRNLRTVQEALGHESIVTTQIYTRITNDDLRAAMTSLRA